MAELQISKDERPGILKEIDSGAIDLIFQAIQEDIYSFPIKSFVRESISNGLDAIIEREIHRKIEDGEPVEKFYRQENDGALLKDSGYHPGYYNNKYLSDHNRVDVYYHEHESSRDIIQIVDRGVGLGGQRLKGFFKLGYSSKRNMKDVIGKFGAGAKAGLATGVDSFLVRTVYNGYETSFMIFKNDYENITPPQEDAIEELWKVKMAHGPEQERTIYWVPTNEMNGVTIELEVKKHNRDKFQRAVREQFQYFNGKVRLHIHKEAGYTSVDKLQDDPYYESDTLLIPQYSTYYVPHILVDGISYGPVSWDELELERRTGKIAIKVRATDVDITQSRESLKWTEKTKKVILKAVKTAQREAEEYVANFLTLNDPKNIFEVLNKYSAVGKNSDDRVTSVFGEFLKMHSVSPRYKFELDGYPVMNSYLSSNTFELLMYPYDVWNVALTSGGKISKTRIDTFKEIQNRIIIYSESTPVGPKLVGHLLNKFETDAIVYIKRNTTRTLEVKEFSSIEWKVSDIKAYMDRIFEKYAHIFVDNYEVQYDEADEELDGKVISKSSEAALQRKLNAEVLYQVFEIDIPRWINYSKVSAIREKKTIKISEIKREFEDKPNIVICPPKYKFLGRLVEVANTINPIEDFQMLYVAEPIIHHFAPYGTVITDYFRNLNLKTGELMLGQHIRTLNTYRKLHELYEEHSWLLDKDNLVPIFFPEHGALINKIARNSFMHSLESLLEHLGLSSHEDERNEILNYLNNLAEFQDILTTLDKDEIARKAQELFGSPNVYHLNAYDSDLIESVKNDLERYSHLKPILQLVGNHSGYTTEYRVMLPLVNELITHLESKQNDNL